VASLDGVEPGLGWRGWRDTAKHRLLQMYISAAVLTEFWADLKPYVSHALDRNVLEQSHVRLYFGEQDAPIMLSAFETAVAAYRRAEPDRAFVRQPPLIPRSGLGSRFDVRRDLTINALFTGATRELGDSLSVLGGAVPPMPPKAGEICRVDRIWAHRVLEVFGVVDRDLERQQEDELRKFDYPRYRAYREGDGDDALGPRVIKQGITAVELTRLLIPDADLSDEWSTVVGSLAIDIGNDLGIIVPSTKCTGPDGPVFRQYRSGETAYLANGEHGRLHSRISDDSAGLLDRFTTSVIEEDFAGDVAVFLADTDRVVELAVGVGELLQLWDGTVHEVTDTHFLLSVQSRLSDDVGAATLELGLLGDADRVAVGPGARVVWMVVQRRDELGRRRRTASVRVTHPATS
jgi:hypothetical protein